PALRRGQTLWGRSQHGQAPGLRGQLGRRQCGAGHPRRQRLRRPVRHRTQVPRDPHVSGRPGQQQPDQGVRRHQGARPAPVVLSDENDDKQRGFAFGAATWSPPDPSYLYVYTKKFYGGNVLLSDVTVLSLEHAVAAPFATRQLADLGARVIKVERPGTGDFARQYDESVNGESSYFVWLNRSKESVALDVT